MVTRSSKEVRYFYQKISDCDISEEVRNELLHLCKTNKELTKFINLLPRKVGDEILDIEKRIKTGLYLQHVRQNQILKKISEAARKRNILIILLKSSAFNGYIYNESGPRGNSDIDILVSKADFSNFKVILSDFAEQHVTSNKKPFTDLYEETWITKSFNHILIDLHTSFINPILSETPNYNLLLKNSFVHPRLNENNLLIMCPEYNLVHLAMHIAKDGKLPHHSLIDALFLLRHENVDVDRLIETSNQWKCLKSVLLMNYALRKILNTTILETKNYDLGTKIAFQIMQYKFKKESIMRRIQQQILALLLTDNVQKIVKFNFIYLSKFLRSLIR